MSENTDHNSAEDGFTGSVSQFLRWLETQLVYGGIRVDLPGPAEDSSDSRPVRRVELVTAGYSDDEALLHRVFRDSMFSLMFWRSTHRGGLYVYEVPVERFDSDEPVTWLKPGSDVFEQIHRAREVVVMTPQGDRISIAVSRGVTLSFSETGPDGGPRDINEPAGVLVVEPIDPDQA